MPRTSAIASSCSLPTPTASQYGSSQNGINSDRPSGGTLSLGARARLGQLPTPMASDAGARGGETFMRGNETLIGAARRLPTPLAQSGRQIGGRTDPKQGRTLLEEAALLPTPTSTEFKRANEDAERTGTKGGRRLAAEASRLPTPAASDSKRTLGQSDRQRGKGPTLHEALIRSEGKLPTPRASDATKGPRSMPEREGKEGPTLPEAINRLAQRGSLPTPTTNDAKAGGAAGNWTPESGRHAGASLTDVAVRELEIPSHSSGPSLSSGESTGIGAARLNPRFVEWMMGLPMGWAMTLPTPISSTSSATASSRKRRPAPSPSSGSDSTEQLSMFGPPTKQEDPDAD